MWRNDRDRPDDPRARERETQRLARDEYDRPRYGSPPGHPGARPQPGWDRSSRNRDHPATHAEPGALSQPPHMPYR